MNVEQNAQNGYIQNILPHLKQATTRPHLSQMYTGNDAHNFSKIMCQ